MSEKSPYKEVGLAAFFNQKRRTAQPHGFSAPEVRKTGHLFESPVSAIQLTQRGKPKSTKKELCLRCKQPRFVVDGLPCRGAR